MWCEQICFFFWGGGTSNFSQWKGHTDLQYGANCWGLLFWAPGENLRFPGLTRGSKCVQVQDPCIDQHSALKTDTKPNSSNQGTAVLDQSVLGKPLVDSDNSKLLASVPDERYT